nr:hypothetical protein [Tanacetum cinerariifolium]
MLIQVEPSIRGLLLMPMGMLIQAEPSVFLFLNLCKITLISLQGNCFMHDGLVITYNDAYRLIDNEAPRDLPVSTLYNRSFSMDTWICRGVALLL